MNLLAIKVLLVCIGFSGILISIVLFLKRAIQRQPKQVFVIAFIVFLGIFLVGWLIPIPEENNKRTPKDIVDEHARARELYTSTPVVSQKTENQTTSIETLGQMSFILINGDAGDFGERVVLNVGTEFEETEIIYYIPPDTYAVTNQDTKIGTQVSVYSGHPQKDGEWEYFVADDNCARPIVLMPGETKDLEIKDGQFVVLSDDSSSVKFISSNIEP